ncbi:MAG: DUF6460 domain-containing protein [Parvularculaceae bacterium]
MADDLKTRLAGRNLGKTILQLIVACIFVGAILAVLDISPFGFWRAIFNGVRNLVEAIAGSFGEIVSNILTYFILGAAIVLPVWLILRLVSRRGSK